jgi:flagellar motor switch protein FliN/FliY
MNPADDSEATASAEVGLEQNADTTPGAPAAGDPVMKAEFQPLPDSAVKGEAASIDILMDVSLPVTVELGKATVTVRQVLDMGQGSVIELDRVAGDPVEVYVSGKILGKGEIVVVNERFGVRMTEILNSVRG